MDLILIPLTTPYCATIWGKAVEYKNKTLFYSVPSKAMSHWIKKKKEKGKEKEKRRFQGPVLSTPHWVPSGPLSWTVLGERGRAGIQRSWLRLRCGSWGHDTIMVLNPQRGFMGQDTGVWEIRSGVHDFQKSSYPWRAVCWRAWTRSWSCATSSCLCKACSPDCCKKAWAAWEQGRKRFNTGSLSCSTQTPQPWVSPPLLGRMHSQKEYGSLNLEPTYASQAQRTN